MSDEPKRKSRTSTFLFLVIAFLVLWFLYDVVDWGGTPQQTSQPATAKTMYVCGYDRCRDSGEYGELVYRTGINVWNNPDPNRGGVHHQESHGNGVSVVGQRRVNAGPGGLWYELAGGGWISDLWLIDQRCDSGNLSEYAFKDCLMGEY